LLLYCYLSYNEDMLGLPKIEINNLQTPLGHEVNANFFESSSTDKLISGNSEFGPPVLVADSYVDYKQKKIIESTGLRRLLFRLTIDVLKIPQF